MRCRWVGCVAGAALAWFAAGCAAAQTPPQAARWQRLLVRQAHLQWGLDAPVAALATQVHQESGWNAFAGLKGCIK